MTLHFHGTPITPITVRNSLAGHCFCVSHAAPQDIKWVHENAQIVMLDNGAFAAWRNGRSILWSSYYLWVEKWLSYATTWAVVPDVIEGSIEQQNYLIHAWPYSKKRSAVVWHLNEPISRLLELLDQDWFLVCLGSTSEFKKVGSLEWLFRMEEVWKAIMQNTTLPPRTHMLRGMAVSTLFPFYSVDSSDVARNHHRKQNEAKRMISRWDARNSPPYRGTKGLLE